MAENHDKIGQNGQNEQDSNGESELYKQILVSAWRRDAIYDERLGIEHVDRLRAACVGPFNREKGGHVGIEIYAECKDDVFGEIFLWQPHVTRA